MTDIEQIKREVHEELGYQPKYKRVDLDTLKMIKGDEFGSGYNAAIYHIKAKYGDLYIMEGK